jgi:hypothetical protein
MIDVKEILEQVMQQLENAYNNPEAVDLDQAISQLQSAKEQYGDKGTMLEDAITALTQAKHSMAQMETAEDVGPSEAFGQAHNALEQAMKSFQ